MKKYCLILVSSIAIVGSSTGCAKMWIWFGMGEKQG